MRAVLAALALSAIAATAHAGSVEIDRGEDGHWRAEGRVNGRKVEFLVDTGASTVALTPEDAARAGIDVRRLRFTQRIRTANGVGFAAEVTLEKVQIGTVRLDDVEALVVQRGLDVSLLGQSFLGRLERMQARGGVLRLQD